MKTIPDIINAKTDLELLDNILDFKLDSESFINNRIIIEGIGNIITKLSKLDYGYSLFSVTKDLSRNLYLIGKWKNRLNYNIKYKSFKWKLKDTIEKKSELIEHEFDEFDIIQLIKDEVKYYQKEPQVISSCVVETLDGYRINKKLPGTINKYNQTEENKDLATILPTSEVRRLIDNNLFSSSKVILNALDKKKKNVEKSIRTFLDKYKDIDYTTEINTPYPRTSEALIGEIYDVFESAETRYYKTRFVKYKKNQRNHPVGRHFGSSNAGVVGNDHTIHSEGKIARMDFRGSYNADSFSQVSLRKIPYNYIDEGRKIIGIVSSNGSVAIFIGPDPKVEEKDLEIMEKEIIKYLSDIQASLSETSLYYSDYARYLCLNDYIDRNKSKKISYLQVILKSLKEMFDEYNYIIKKKKSKGKIISVTDNIIYDGTLGKIKYNDFSIQINDEFIKNKLSNKIEEYLTEFYRGKKEEQEILDEVLERLFNSLYYRINSKKKEAFEIKIIINNIVEVKLSSKISERVISTYTDREGNKQNNTSQTALFYLNGFRFNKKEVLVVLKELVCYRDKKEAESFIKNVGRLGLSVYIGITSGYEVNLGQRNNPDNKLFRFRKKKGRSKYELLLDGDTIPITGKKLINILYEDFIGENVANFKKKIPKLIYECSESAFQYLKYKVMIDASYEAFKNKAKEYLVKKIKDVNGEETLFFNKKNFTTMDAINVTGASGNKYTIAYDSRNSYVFMNPTYDESINAWKDGKYICMIDQSNIKSNIGYDTIVAKLMALKYDSSITHNIYNLEEEL